MSRFESSTFVRDENVMNQQILISTCEELGWMYVIKGDALLITDIGTEEKFYGEYAIKVEHNIVTYNTYYLENTADYVEKLRQKYTLLNAEYSRHSVIGAFKSMGFTYKSIPSFVPTETEMFRFYMVGRSLDPNEEEPVGQILFSIKPDGTVVSDSNYLPDDVNKRAHAAMDKIDENFSSKRVMVKKEIPFKYRNKVKRSTSNNINLKNEQ